MLFQLSRVTSFGILKSKNTGVIILIFLSLFASACAKRQLTVKVNIVPGANGNNPVALDLVSVNSKDLEKEIAKLTAADWFQKRSQYLLDYSKPGVLSVSSGEWVPGQSVPAVRLPAPSLLAVPHVSSKVTVLVFANYFTPGPHRAELQPKKITTIELGQNDLAIITDKK